jgi:hypothetical protein
MIMLAEASCRLICTTILMTGLGVAIAQVPGALPIKPADRSAVVVEEPAKECAAAQDWVAAERNYPGILLRMAENALKSCLDAVDRAKPKGR